MTFLGALQQLKASEESNGEASGGDAHCWIDGSVQGGSWGEKPCCWAVNGWGDEDCLEGKWKEQDGFVPLHGKECGVGAMCWQSQACV